MLFCWDNYLGIRKKNENTWIGEDTELWLRILVAFHIWNKTLSNSFQCLTHVQIGFWAQTISSMGIGTSYIRGVLTYTCLSIYPDNVLLPHHYAYQLYTIYNTYLYPVSFNTLVSYWASVSLPYNVIRSPIVTDTGETEHVIYIARSDATMVYPM